MIETKRIKYREGYKYQLEEDACFSLDVHPDHDIFTRYFDFLRTGHLYLRRGYAWDGPSGITIDTNTFMRGSIIHDPPYQAMRMGELSLNWRENVDKELKRICLEDGMCNFRAWYVYNSVRKFAGYAANPKNKKRILEAP